MPGMVDAARLPTRLHELRQALTALTDTRSWHGDLDGALLAVQEAVVNATRHGEGVREVIAWLDGPDLVVDVADHGEGFDPAGYLATQPDLFAEAGRGIWLMGQLASEFAVHPEPEGTRLRLRFGPGPARVAATPPPPPTPRLAELGMTPLEALGGAAVLVDPRLVVRETAGPVRELLGVDDADMRGRDMRGVAAEVKLRFAEPAAYESTMLDLLAHPERDEEGMFLLASGQFLRQHAVALRDGDVVVGRVLLFMPAASHIKALASFQRALLPKVPEGDDLAFGAIYHPAEVSGLVGGDFYDFFALPSGRGVVVGDVSGRGPFAAAAGVTARAYLRASLSTTGLAGAVSAVNQALLDELDEEQFVTMAMATRENRDVWTLALCGHPPPLLWRGGEVTTFASRGMLLGMHETGEWGRQLFHLEPGDVLLLYTDGVTEAGPANDQYGIDRLAEALREVAHQPPQQLVEAIDARVHSFTAGHIADDHVLVAVARR